MSEVTTALDDGVTAATENPRERADVQRWMERIEQVSRHDEPARAQYAKDRRYARGDSGYEVDANLVATYIDITEAFLYAKNPDVDVLPSRAVEPPDADTVREAVEATLPGMAPQQGVLGMLAPPMDPMLHQQIIEAAVAERIEQITARFRKRQREAKAFAETLELVIARLWLDANLKRRGRRMVRSALTVGLGILKASWQERRGQDPQTLQAINDLQDNIGRIKAEQAGMAEAHGDELEAKLAEYQRQLTALQGKTEQVTARGFVVDAIAPEDFRVAAGYSIADHLDAPWNAHRIPMRVEDAKAEFGLDDEALQSAIRYTARKPECVGDESPTHQAVSARDADAFVKDGEALVGEWVMVWEIWDRTTNSVLTGIEGMTRWARAPWQPGPTTRFYPFFLLCLSEVDGQRHPQSLVTRSAKLIDEYNRIGSAEAEHRRRTLPKTAINAGDLPPAEVDKIRKGGVQEIITLQPTNPMQPVRDLVHPIAYAAMDPALYDRSRVVAELERIWGIQEALSGAVQVAKTATEAEIQQGGFQARSGGRRELLEDALNDLAQYTAEVASCYLTTDDVVHMAGPDAFWLEHTGPEDLRRFVAVEIRAGSSGKPNTSAERQSWSTLLPLLAQSVDKLGALRGSSPADVADCHERLLRITAERMGDRIDVDSLVPPPGPMAGMVPPGAIPPTDPSNPAPEGAPPAGEPDPVAA